jgi:DNA-binding transcriptional LysR family regulator
MAASRLDDMLTFVRVVDASSFTAAAHRLGISKSVVSRRMSELENRLGTRLLNRTTRRLSLTEVGQAFYQRSVQILAEVDEAERAAASLSAAPRGVLRVNAPMSFGILHLGPAIASFLERYPDVEVDLDLNDRIVDLVEEGYDVAVRVGKLRDSTLVARRLAPARRVVCGSPAYLAQHGRPRVPDDLTRHNCLVYTNAPLGEQWLFPVDGVAHAVRVAGTMRSSNGDVLREAAIAGVGLVLLPTFIISDALARGALERVLPNYEPPGVAVAAVYPQSRHVSPKVRAFIDFLAARFGAEPYWDAAMRLAGV